MKHAMSACGMYASRRVAQDSIDLLKQDGFTMSEISILTRRKAGPQNFVHGQKTKIHDGAIVGAVIGFVVLGLLGFVLSYYTMSEPSAINSTAVSNFSTKLLILDTILGFSVGAFIGAAAGALAGIGIPQMVNSRYGFYLQQGGLLIAVHAKSDEEKNKIIDILKKTGAQDINPLYDAELWELANTITL